MASKRNVGLDFCRISGMLGIVTMHILGVGGVLSRGGWVAWGLEIAAYCTLDLFALLSGYLSCRKKQFSSYRIIELLTSLLFYTVIITGAFLIFSPSSFSSPGRIIISVFPVRGGAYWYIICYIVLFLLMPCLNLVVQRLENDALQKLCVLLFVLLSVIPSLGAFDFFKMGEGYSVAWLAVCYIWGGAYRKLGKQPFAGFEWLIFLASTGIVLLVRILGIWYPGYMMAYTSPFMVINAVMLLQLGARYRRNPRPGTIKIVTYLSGTAFDVYLLHCHSMVYNNLIRSHFSWISDLNPIMLPIVVLLCAVTIYLAGTVSAAIRKGVFRIFRIDKLNGALSNLADRIIVKEI